MTSDTGLIAYIFFTLLLLFIYLWLGTGKFKPGWRKRLFSPNGIMFGKGFVYFRYIFLFSMVVVIIMWKVLFS